jgi:hypothetical protein
MVLTHYGHLRQAIVPLRLKKRDERRLDIHPSIVGKEGKYNVNIS